MLAPPGPTKHPMMMMTMPATKLPLIAMTIPTITRIAARIHSNEAVAPVNARIAATSITPFHPLCRCNSLPTGWGWNYPQVATRRASSLAPVTHRGPRHPHLRGRSQLLFPRGALGERFLERSVGARARWTRSRAGRPGYEPSASRCTDAQPRRDHRRARRSRSARIAGHA
jgi:hypothetical protein